ncbi:Plexin-B2 [Acipenser ruthenus]|uniref:Plexin-B2 n=1 Tax=Acipenser ruthenus TaxID=7906 RepID=A0A444UU01_ACIRT|nr:Plexin-B2 [Acipenser ruthenus]
MAAWPLTLCLLLCLCSGSLVSNSYRHFYSNTEINNVVQDPGTGRVYVGAVNTIYQLDEMLQKQDSIETGPKKDNKLCTPPKFSGCVTKLTNNSNKLLLVNRANGTLVVCGSLFRGICSLLSLENVSKVEYYYVVSTEDKLSVVGVLTVVQRHGRNTSVFLVGKGYGPSDTTKLITTRLLQESEGVDLFESYDESSVWQVNAYTNLFRHIFRLAFQHKNFTYFLFSRTNAKNEMGNYTFISRVCQTDTHYYSYMELQLNCSQGGGQQYSKVQAAFVAFPGERLARSMDVSGRYGRVTAEDKVLFVVFGTDSQTDQSQASALCMYSLKEINKRLKEIQDACYSGAGNIDEKQAVYTPYSISNGVWPKNCEQKTPGDHPCGADFLPSPLASTPDFGISAEAVITYEEHLSAVAVVVENEHTIAFLGTDRGWIYKVHLSGSAEQYDKKTVGNTRVNKNLFFDAGQDHIYVTTEKEVTRVPVQECHWRSSCQSCVTARDPYCGWCVAEGKCTRRSACRRAVEDNHWIWSLSQECVQITGYSPENMSRMQPSRPRVSMTLVPFPDITESDQLECDFGGSKSQAVIEPGKSITCSPPEVVSIPQTPEVVNIPQTPESQDFVAVEVKLTFKDSHVELAVGQYRFYDCSAAAKMLTNTPCASCVTSKWRCQWNIKDHKCSENDAETQDVYVIKHAQGKTFKMGTELMGSTEVEIVLKEDQTYEFQGYEFSYDKGQMRDLLFYVKEGSNKIDSNLNVTLYNCSFGREDCSLCKAADPKYGCVWCSHPKSCLYSTTCPREEELCPMPKILDVSSAGNTSP